MVVIIIIVAAVAAVAVVIKGWKLGFITLTINYKSFVKVIIQLRFLILVDMFSYK